MRERARGGLQRRFVIHFVGLLIMAAGTIEAALVWQNYRDALAAERYHAVGHARSVAMFAEAGLRMRDPSHLPLTLQALAAAARLRAIEIYDANGILFTQYHRSGASSADRVLRLPDGTGLDVFEHAEWVGCVADAMIATVPIWSTAGPPAPAGKTDPARGPGDLLGYARVTLGLEQLHAQVVDRILAAIVLFAVIILVFSSATLVFVRNLTQPLRDLLNTTTAIADGRRGERVPEVGPGEIGVLARSFNHMADRLAETHASTERVIEQRTRELIRANEAKSQFLASMSHEIRTPLTAILGYAEILLELELTAEERRDAVRAVHRNGEHLLQVIDDILNISKIEAGKVQIESLDCSPAEVLDDVLIMMRPRAERKGIALELEHVDRLPEVIRTDPTRLRQILINLVGNAIKYTPEGSVRIRAGLTHELPDMLESSEKPMLRVEITDTGIGMSPEQFARVFQPFTQADETMTRKFGGTGLGLAISQRLAEMLGGTIAAQSELGRGSTMRLWVAIGQVDKDRQREPSADRRLATPDADPIAVDARPLEGLRILLAEDGVDNQRLISLLLERAGAEVELVDNGESAVDAALAARESHRQFDVILMDMQMPVMDGYAATGELRSRDYKGPIVAITAHTMAGDRQKCLAAGCDGYARKPIKRRELMELIRRHARAAQSGSPASLTPSDRTADALEAPFAELSAGLAELEQALAERDFEALAASAERIREGADRRGLTHLTEAAARLRTAVEARGEMDSLREAVYELTALCEQTTRVTSHG